MCIDSFDAFNVQAIGVCFLCSIFSYQLKKCVCEYVINKRLLWLSRMSQMKYHTRYLSFYSYFFNKNCTQKSILYSRTATCNNKMNIQSFFWRVIGVYTLHNTSESFAFFCYHWISLCIRNSVAVIIWERNDFFSILISFRREIMRSTKIEKGKSNRMERKRERERKKNEITDRWVHLLLFAHWNRLQCQLEMLLGMNNKKCAMI